MIGNRLTIGEEIARAFREQPHKAWSIPELVAWAYADRPVPRLAREYVAAAAKLVAARLGWVRHERMNGMRREITYAASNTARCEVD